MSDYAIANNVVYSTCNDGVLYALDANSGNTLWEYKIGTGDGGSPIVIDGFIFLGNLSGEFCCLK
jgi:outer membrane protein assembly factor BamB